MAIALIGLYFLLQLPKSDFKISNYSIRNKMSKINYREALKNLLSKGYEFELDLDDEKAIINSNTDVTGFCKCGEEISKKCKDLLRRGCRSCNTKALEEVPTDKSLLPKNLGGEQWVAVPGAFISSKGRACNAFGHLYSLDERFRWLMYDPEENKRSLQYAAIVVAKAFKIEDWDSLGGQECSFVIRYRDNDRANICLDNLYVGTRAQVGEENGQKSRQSDRFKEAMNTSIVDKIETTKYKKINELLNHIIFEDGTIFNSKKGQGANRFCSFSTSSLDSNSKQYFKLNTKDKDYLVHRLVCFAFHPIEGNSSLEDYKDLFVNHKDGDTLNNNANNLEWTTASENMIHAYNTSLNKKVQGVIQYNKNEDGEIGDLITEYPSIAEAARKTGIVEQEIRNSAQGKVTSRHRFIWAFKDPAKAKKFSEKYSSR
jgi:hypothetical protein